ncbi:MAG: hypothetical protein HRO68_10030 [Nitrosopumilus sp.]|nr:hypothetical protein [Nitrosopumilus sp.]
MQPDTEERRRIRISVSASEYRLLEKIAAGLNYLVSELVTEKISDFLNLYVFTNKFYMIRDTKKTVSKHFELTSDSVLKILSKIDADEVTQSFKTMTNDFSFEKITKVFVRTWFKFNDLELNEFDENTKIKFVCKNTMSKNWNTHQANVFVKIYKNFGFNGTVITTETNLLIFKVSKTKQ